MRRLLPVCLAAMVSLSTLRAEAPKPTAEQLEFFEKSVRPLLIEQCQSCHGEKKQQAGLRLDTAAGMLKGSDDGAVVVAGDLEKSKLIQSVRRKGDLAMPPDKALSKEQVAVLEQWVKIGAPFPAGTAPLKADAAKTHWAFQPIADPAPPGVQTNPIDAFIRNKLKEKNLVPTARADKRTLARRVFFDLIGLPPTADELDAFEKDRDPKAYEKLVESLLARPQYGERWGRYWLDVARYADSKGYVFQEDQNYPYSYTYRDYVIRSFNEDKPYDQFVREQLAADKMKWGDDKTPLAAMGFLTVGRRFSNNIHDITDDRIDVVSRGLMGLTVACARCHDHKFDPIPAADYYGLYGVFASSNEPKELPLISDPTKLKEYEGFLKELKRLQDAADNEKPKWMKLRLEGFQGIVGTAVIVPPKENEKLLPRPDRREAEVRLRELNEFQTKSPGAPPRAMVMVDNPKPTDQRIFLRGNPGSAGPKAPLQVPAIIGGANRKPFTDGSGRLELANAIASKNNPLTARVFVNRVWMWHFGQGLVRTPSDFGVRSEPPTHPELLDWLASRFIEDGWSLKKLHKRILLSDTYTQSSQATPAALAADPENRWLGHQNRHRHDFEAMRDSLLSASGTLDLTPFGRSGDLFKAPFSKRRALYGYVDRQNIANTLQVFDFASPEVHSPQRFQTTVPQQALFLMNSPFVAEVVRSVVAREAIARETDPMKKMTKLYRAVLSRDPTKAESELAQAFLKEAELIEAKKGLLTEWEQLAQVLLLSNEFAFVD